MKFKIDLVKSYQDNLNEAVNENLVPYEMTSISKLEVGKQYYVTYKSGSRGSGNATIVFNGFTSGVKSGKEYTKKPPEFDSMKEIKSKLQLKNIKDFESNNVAIHVDLDKANGSGSGNYITLYNGKWEIFGNPITAIFTMKPSDMDNGI